MSMPITTSFDTYVSRYPFLASLTYKGSEDDDTYKSWVDIKGSDWSPVPDSVKTHAVYGLDAMVKRGETAPFTFDAPGPAGTKETAYVNWALGVIFTENLIMDAQYGVIEKVVSDLGKADPLTRNLMVAQLYDNFFATTYYTGNDGLALGSASHTTYGAGAVRANILGTPAPLSDAGVQDLLTVMRRQRNERGRPKPAIKGNASITVGYPPEMEFIADKLFDRMAEYKPDSDHTATINVLKKFKWNLQMNPYLTSTANWFLMNEGEKGIRMVNRQPLTTDSERDVNTKGMRYDVRSRWCIHPEMWENIYGSNG
jgi:hypothetical protein